MKLIVGLGNPGPRYARNRHNIGFLALEAIHGAGAFSPWRKKFQGEIADGAIAGERCLLLKPQTFMNESGRSVGETMRFHKLAPADVIVLHDELDLAPGKLRAKLGGGNAGHNGLRSICAHIGPDFWRIRLGIGHPGRKELVQPWVLGDFAKADDAWLGDLLAAIAGDSRHLADGDANRFMTAVAEATRSEPAPARGKPAPTQQAPAPAADARPAPEGKAGEGPRKWDMVARHSPDQRAPGTLPEALGAERPSGPAECPDAEAQAAAGATAGSAPAPAQLPEAHPNTDTPENSTAGPRTTPGATPPDPPGSLGEQLRAWLKRGSPKT